MTASVHDVASYILEKLAPSNPITTWQLQKLVYYCWAWGLVWDDEELFPERIEAWADGPVCPTLYEEHRGKFRITSGELAKGDPSNLNDEQKKTIDAVLDAYGGKTGYQLSTMTHLEDPWIEARGDTPPWKRSNNAINMKTTRAFYAGFLSSTTES